MALTLLEVKDKIKDHVKKIFEIDEFRIVFAERGKDLSGESPWIIGINFVQEVKSEKTNEILKLPSSLVISVNAETGEIISVSAPVPIHKTHT